MEKCILFSNTRGIHDASRIRGLIMRAGYIKIREQRDLYNDYHTSKWFYSIYTATMKNEGVGSFFQYMGEKVYCLDVFEVVND